MDNGTFAHIITTIEDNDEAVKYHDNYFGRKVSEELHCIDLGPEVLQNNYNVCSIIESLKRDRKNNRRVILHIDNFQYARNLPEELVKSILNNCVFIGKSGIEDGFEYFEGFAPAKRLQKTAEVAGQNGVNRENSDIIPRVLTEAEYSVISNFLIHGKLCTALRDGNRITVKDIETAKLLEYAQKIDQHIAYLYQDAEKCHHEAAGERKLIIIDEMLIMDFVFVRELYKKEHELRNSLN